MSEPKFTPGPWRAGIPLRICTLDHRHTGRPNCDYRFTGEWSNQSLSCVASETGAEVITDAYTSGNGVIHEADAHLIAAAPDLYAALSAIVEHHGGDPIPVGSRVRCQQCGTGEGFRHLPGCFVYAASRALAKARGEG
jgi:hypothetical protein